MREILFRGKAVCNGDWVYGGITWNPSRKKVFIHTKSDECEVIPETVGQYTGMKGKTGKNIFEGDIVRYSNDSNNLIVTFEDYGWVLKMPGAKYYKHRLEWCDNEKLIVIGNIWDNPELLEGEQ